ncbi:hypothetical protein DSO57_1022755 [Entomophthora muscae]|uniref:Uncharacterized protein n=1 Tax=Entomophthora muscae TaxID=34485 RepID=A0ACC2TQD2_9FUNG|nr:hypothetical protein DSO57_1022755 [Entomophthora muscae]
MSSRTATHAGSWYSDDKSFLYSQLSAWLENVFSSAQDRSYPIAGVNAIISPHAGYEYSGETAAYAFACVEPKAFKKVFILGPSHHSYLQNCALTSFDYYSTPLGDLKINHSVNSELQTLGVFSTMAESVDEDEHSIEMQLPYLARVFEGYLDSVEFIPVLFGKIFAPYLKDQSNLFVISSDFCHWGSRFQYQMYSSDPVPSDSLSEYHMASNHSLPIHTSIENLDREGMSKIEKCTHAHFDSYLKKTNNTICGRHPLAVLLAAIEELYPEKSRQSLASPKKALPRISFNYYAQSSQITQPKDSSVSYAAGHLLHPE